MFTEQPAPPQQPAAEVKAYSDASVPKASSLSLPAQHGIAPPESIPPQSSPVVVETKAASPEPAPDPSPSPSQPASQTAPATQSTAGSATTQRREEIEHKLAEIVGKQRAKQKEVQQQEAATESAKYAGSKEFERARQAAKKPTLPKDVQEALLRKIAAQQAKVGKGTTVAKGSSNSGAGQSPALNGGGSLSVTAIGASPSSYAALPILPTGQAQLRLPLGRNLNLVFPLTIPAPITSAFGWRTHPISGSARFHQGLDLGAPMGSPVIAAMGGRVETADFLNGYGLTVILRHGNTQQTLYAHMSQVFVKPGDWVKQGHLIGQVGSTGLSTGPHLHFELHQLTSEGWTALDPAMVFNQAIAAVHQGLQSKQATNRKGQSLRLAAFGLLDLNATDVAKIDQPYSVLSEFLSSSSSNQAGMLVPFAVLPSAVPELSWFVSPIVDDLIVDESTALLSGLGLTAPPAQTLSFQPLPDLAAPAQPTAFKPLAAPLDPSTVQLATAQPFADWIASSLSTSSQYLQAFGITNSRTKAPESDKAPVLPSRKPLAYLETLRTNATQNRAGNKSTTWQSGQRQPATAPKISQFRQLRSGNDKTN